MWFLCFFASILSFAVFALVALAIHNSRFTERHRFSLFYALLGGTVLSALFLFFPVHYAQSASSLGGVLRAALLAVFNSMQIFGMGCEFSVVLDGLAYCHPDLVLPYQIWTGALFVLAPAFTFSFVLALFKNLSASIAYGLAYWRDVYVFSDLNERSLALATDIKQKHPRAVLCFAGVLKKDDESAYELFEQARQLHAICFRHDLLSVRWDRHSVKTSIRFFAIHRSEDENLNQALQLIEAYRHREGTHLYVFSTRIEAELLLSSVNKGAIRVRRINEVQSLVNRVLYEQGDEIFRSAIAGEDGEAGISAVIVGLGMHGTEMLKALSWFCQMDGYRLKIRAFDKDPLAGDQLAVRAPELLSPHYNGRAIPGEAQYDIAIRSDMDVRAAAFADAIREISDATYVFVCLGSDSLNVSTAVNLRMYFERMGTHPVIQAVVYSPRQRKALEDLRNFRQQPYDIQFIGDVESSYTEEVIVGTELERQALSRHLKENRPEEDFWNFEYNYRSSVASAIHFKARVLCGIKGAGKREEDLTADERQIIESLEHRRWNAYMRAEGYIYSGSSDPATRNDLAKMHHDLVSFDQLDEAEKRKDGRVGTL